MVAKNFPDAPDFNPGSQRWRREIEARIKAAEEAAARTERNRQADKKAAAAAVGAAAQSAARALSALSIDGGDAPKVTATPFAYFTKSGYPAGGINLSWTYTAQTNLTTDLASAVRYDVWIRPVRPDAALPEDDDTPIGPDADLDSQRVTGTPNTYTTVRGLECNTQYAIKVQVMSITGSGGDYSDEVFVTTPNEITQIPAGSFSASGGSGYAKLTWTGSTPSGYTESQVTGAADIHTPGYYFTAGSQGADGKVYFAEGYNSNKGHYLAIDPVAKTSTLVQGSATTVGYWTLGSGMCAPDGRIFFLPMNYGTSENHIFIIDPSSSAVTVPTVSGAGTGKITASVMHSNGTIYGFGSQNNITVGNIVTVTAIDPTGLTSTATNYTITTPTGSGVWAVGGAVEASNGLVYLVAAGLYDPVNTAFIGVFDPVAGTLTLTRMGVTTSLTNGWGAGALLPNGNICFAPAYTGTHGDTSPALIVSPTAGTATLGAAIPNSMLEYGSPNTGPSAVAGLDGCVYYIGQTSNTSPYPTCLVRYDPSADTYTAITLAQDSGATPFYTLASTAAGGAVGVSAYPPGGNDQIASNVILYLSTQAGTATPNYLKYMQIERLTGSGWVPVNTLAAPGTTVDLEQPGRYTYRMVPVSTAGTRGTPSPSITVTIGN